MRSTACLVQITQSPLVCFVYGSSIGLYKIIYMLHRMKPRLGVSGGKGSNGVPMLPEAVEGILETVHRHKDPPNSGSEATSICKADLTARVYQDQKTIFIGRRLLCFWEAVSETRVGASDRRTASSPFDWGWGALQAASPRYYNVSLSRRHCTFLRDTVFKALPKNSWRKGPAKACFTLTTSIEGFVSRDGALFAHQLRRNMASPVACLFQDKMGRLDHATAAPPPYEAVSSQTEPLRPSSVSLHTLEPPQYRDEPAEQHTDSGRTGSANRPPNEVHLLQHIPAALRPQKNGEIRTLEPSLSSNAPALFALLQAQAGLPPQPVIRLLGTHREVIQQDNKKENRLVTDFDIQVNCSYIFAHQAANPQAALDWYSLVTVPDDEKALRGGFFKRRLRKPDADDEESAPRRTDAEDARLWSHSFCAAASHRWFPLIFRFRRKLLNWNLQTLEKQLTAGVRATGYRGDVAVSSTLQNPGFSIYSDHWMNRALNNAWIWWACVVLQLWIVCWPVLLLCTGTYDGVSSEWLYKRRIILNEDEVERGDAREMQFRMLYASESEQQWYAKWGEAMIEAAFARRQGWLDRGDLEARQRVGETPQTGNSTVDTAVGIFTGIHGALRSADRITGWGAHRGASGAGLSMNLSHTSILRG
ncbi:hypothetical protein FH972_026355 [Carpinus fangiana]|uniref:Uncharacterized protein n=1 Tax=Carpinus fangiana TaxID=176857 RepID=A0A5N6L439_9ROSI|nr:hypothetical protein FH972_026355 [Carpinus fangiana]